MQVEIDLLTTGNLNYLLDGFTRDEVAVELISAKDAAACVSPLTSRS